MNQKLYYTPPSDEIFEEVKAAAIAIWRSYDDTYGYATEKVGRIKDIGNIEDNVMYMVAMFDMDNQRKLLASLGLAAQMALVARAPQLSALVP